MKTYRFLVQHVLATLLFLIPLTAGAISGNFSDSGGGEYWCNVYVESTTAGYSFKSLTGKDESTAMNEFRGDRHH